MLFSHSNNQNFPSVSQSLTLIMDSFIKFESYLAEKCKDCCAQTAKYAQVELLMIENHQLTWDELSSVFGKAETKTRVSFESSFKIIFDVVQKSGEMNEMHEPIEELKRNFLNCIEFESEHMWSIFLHKFADNENENVDRSAVLEFLDGEM